MDRRLPESPVYSRQWSGTSSSTGSLSPAVSPLHPNSRFSTVRRTQNVAAKAAAQRLAQVMASQAADGDEYDDDDDLGFQVGATPLQSNRNSILRPGSNRSPSPALGRNFMEPAPSVRSTSAGRPSMSVRSMTIASPSRGSLRTEVSLPPLDPPSSRPRERRLTSNAELSLKDAGNQREASALRDELDMLQEENDVILDKLRRADEKREEAEARARELEKQVHKLI